ncbi:MAG TPA: EAL domain-containing protein, partial [Gemmataceae bacterium]|nr:EAL domain-containing protein [Gemmataceae bacterium]
DWAPSYDEAMAAIAKGQHDVYLVDYRLGEHDGLEILRQARAAGCARPIILLTGQGDGEVDIAAMQAGAADYLVKGQLDSQLLERSIRYSLEQNRTLEALRESEERYALAAHGANDGLWDWDLQTDEVYYSPRWKALLGCEESEIGAGPQEWLQRVHAEDLRRVQAEIDDHCQGRSPHFENEHRLLHKDNTYRWVLTRGLAVRGRDGRAMRMAGSLTDITEDKVADPLTRLPNRVLFIDRLARTLERAKRDQDLRFAVLFLDLDRFKVINDSLGHLIGDQLLIDVSRRLEACLRSCDTIARLTGQTTLARLGGDEFTILLEDIKSIDNAVGVAERIQKDLAIPFVINGADVFTSASIGITLGPCEYHEPEELLRDADAAMYCAKAGGKARCEVFDAEMRKLALARLQLESDMRRGIERREFCLHYQPIQTLEGDRIIGFEALVRWRHPERGFLSPAEFIPVAEETGHILVLGEWILQEACRQMKTWQDCFQSDPPLIVSVNLSCKQFLQIDLATRIEQVLSTSGLDPRSLKLEITESAIMDDPESAAAVLTRLRSLGVKVGLDDFGTGYSSLNYLHRFPIDTLKIDRSFVNQMGNAEENLQVVQTIVGLAHNLAMDVIAEGIETEGQRHQLASMSCEYGQGYYFSKPVDPAKAEKLLFANANKEEVVAAEV